MFPSTLPLSVHAIHSFKSMRGRHWRESCHAQIRALDSSYADSVIRDKTWPAIRLLGKIWSESGPRARDNTINGSACKMAD